MLPNKKYDRLPFNLKNIFDEITYTVAFLEQNHTQRISRRTLWPKNHAFDIIHRKSINVVITSLFENIVLGVKPLRL